ncbi:MAG TPA: 2-deoxy-D-gluconate 3-dehydrogenase [Firmicutes bacterium]|jgi:2-dehydro-3-deoxy-D-gluconate 5-dehydrogenase|nr:2-deoxy-D-gluconate 3-dehydrogenase [Bacillota bacterium]
MNLFDLSEKKAVVTGAAAGLGRGIVEGLLEAGAEVIIIDISEKVNATVKELSQDGVKIHAVQGDLSDRGKLKEAFDKAVKLLGGNIDILINCAGIQRRNKCEEFTLEDWDAVVEVNLSSVFILSQLAGRIMLKQGKGKIINMASMLSFFGGYTVPAYAAAKGGVAQLTKALSNEWAGKGINVNAIAPGYMDTSMNTALINDANRNREILNRIPAGRWGLPTDVKGIAVFLASSASDYIDGAIIPVDGGYLSR